MANYSHEQRFQQAVSLAQHGKRSTAAQIFAGILTEEPANEAAWLWLAACVDDPQKQRYCLDRALKLNPGNYRARRALSHLSSSVTPSQRTQASASIPRTGSALVFDMPVHERTVAQVDTVPTEPPATETAPARRGSRGWVIFGLLVLILALAAYFFFQNGGLENFGSRGLQFDGNNLAQRILDAPPGATITLEKGEFISQEVITIPNPIIIQGAGVDETQLTLLGAGSAVHITGSGEVVLKNLSIRYDGDAAADVIVVEDGTATLTDCRIAGGLWDSQEQAGGRGLVLQGKSSGIISRCEFVHNDYLGVEIRDQATPTLRENLIHQNRGGGLAVSGSAQPLIEKNIVRENNQSGLVYYDSAAGKSMRNEITDNSQSGIEVNGQARPLIVENTVQRNLEFGARVNEEAQPMLLSNSFLQNGKAGIAYFNHAAGAAQDNDCSQNEMHGISVNEEAVPFLQENRCKANLQVGIDYWGNSGGSAVNNETTENGLQGIALHEQAHPILENNVSNRNNDSGIIFWGASGGTARNNNCSENRLNGISVHADAQPVILENTCSDNNLSGIAFYDRAGGSASANQCAGNEQNKILVADQARPELGENLCSDK